MASISIDIDLSDFDLDEILEELEDRYNSSYRRQSNQKEINEFIKKMKIDSNEMDNLNLSIIDKIKIDFLMNNLNKITINNLEKLI
jgi:hypothetical protein